jgi:hypothetical protein
MIEFFLILIAWVLIAQMWSKPKVQEPQTIIHHHYYGDVYDDFEDGGPGEEQDDPLEDEDDEVDPEDLEPDEYWSDKVVPIRRKVG